MCPTRTACTFFRKRHAKILSILSLSSPSSLDLSPEGETLYVASNGRYLWWPSVAGFFTVDTESLRISDAVRPIYPALEHDAVRADLVVESLAAMRSGTVFLKVYPSGTRSATYLYRYNPADGIASPEGSPDSSGDIYKSADSTRFVIGSERELSLYDDAQGIYTASKPLSGGVITAISPDGKKILTSDRRLLDNALETAAHLQALSWDSQFWMWRDSATFGPDGRRIYISAKVVTTSGSIYRLIEVFDADTGLFLGYVPNWQQDLRPGQATSSIAVGSLGMAVLIGDRGFYTLDVRALSQTSPLDLRQTKRLTYDPPVGIPASPFLPSFRSIMVCRQIRSSSSGDSVRRRRRSHLAVPPATRYSLHLEIRVRSMSASIRPATVGRRSVPKGTPTLVSCVFRT